MTRPVTIDTQMHGRSGVTAAYLLVGAKVALVETGAKSSLQNVMAGLAANGVERLDSIIVTHIHLDHAGAAGSLAMRFPDAKVYVHPVGAPHLVSPDKLWSSATRIYGAAMDSMWGGVDPVPEDRIEIVKDGDVIDLGDRKLRAVETPGHASHHHAYFDEASGDLFTGDAVGVFLEDLAISRPTTPPPELDLEAYIASIERLGNLGSRTLWFTHFGPHEATPEIFTDAMAKLRLWESWVRAARTKTKELDEVTSLVEKAAAADMEGRLSADEIDRLEQTTSYRMNVMGYMRYLEKKGE